MEPTIGARRLAAMPAARPRRSALFTALAIALVVAAACNSGVSIPGTGPLVIIETRGGMCPAGACGDTITLERDGRVRSASKPPNDLGVVPADAMAALTAAIQSTDYLALKSHPFTGECPVNFDGQELIFTFAVGGGTQRVASCEIDIDWGHPLFVAVGVALGAFVPLPTT